MNMVLMEMPLQNLAIFLTSKLLEYLPQDFSEVAQKALSYDTLESTPHDTCIPTSSDLSYLRCSLKPPSRDFERFTSPEASSFSVEEDYHGQGMATILIQHLTAIARQKGVKRFTAEVLAQNISMLKVFRHSGLPVRQENEREVVHVTMSLVGEDS